jgi:hypothetical protein
LCIRIWSLTGQWHLVLGALPLRWLRFFKSPPSGQKRAFPGISGRKPGTVCILRAAMSHLRPAGRVSPVPAIDCESWDPRRRDNLGLSGTSAHAVRPPAGFTSDCQRTARGHTSPRGRSAYFSTMLGQSQSRAADFEGSFWLKPVAVWAVYGEKRSGRAFTIFTVSTLTRTTCPTSRTMYSGSSSRFGSLVIPLRLSVLT